MVFQKGVVTNPGGNPNPNIKDAPKPGPVTDAGKMKVAFSNMVTGENSKWLKLLRRRGCDKCLLGERIEQRKVGNKTIDVTIPRQCMSYERGSKKCTLPITKMVTILKYYYEIMENDTIDLQKGLILQSIADAQSSREIETIKKGHPGFYTKEFQDQAHRSVNELNKLKFGVQRHQHLHVDSDSADKLLKKVFEGDDGE